MVALQRFTSLLFASSQSYTGCHQPIVKHQLFTDTAQGDFAERFERGKLSFTGDVLQA